MPDINNCQDYVYTFFDNELFHFSPAVITFLEYASFIAFIGGIIWVVCEVFLPRIVDKAKKIYKRFYTNDFIIIVNGLNAAFNV